jgi:hypothetical protein
VREIESVIEGEVEGDSEYVDEIDAVAEGE